MQNKLVLSLFSLCFSLSVLADNDREQKQIAERLNDQRMETAQEPLQPPSPPMQAQSPDDGDKQSISLTREELINQPALVIRAVLSALSQNNSENVAFLFPIYQQIPAQYQDPLLDKWINAVIEKQRKNYRTSIRLYRSILAEQNDILPVRLQLAIALFENNQTEAAEDQFQKLRAEKLPPQIQQVITQYLNAIANLNPWTFKAGLTYLHDPNLNNAPKTGTRIGNWLAPKRESGQGVGMYLELGKKWGWGNGFFNELRLYGNGKHYWNNKKYNEYTGRTSLGLGFQNAVQTVTLLPFMEQTWYAGGSARSETVKRFSKAGGSTLEWRYWLSPQWQLDSVYEYAEQRYARRKHLNGNYHFLGGSLVYLANAGQYWFIGANYNRTSTRDKDDSYIRRGVQVGWGQEWRWGLSSRLSLSYARKHYYAPMPIFNITQRNNEYGVSAGIWHRAVHFWGITPRLTWNYTKVNSNHAFYSYDKNRVFLELSKKF